MGKLAQRAVSQLAPWVLVWSLNDSATAQAPAAETSPSFAEIYRRSEQSFGRGFLFTPGRFAVETRAWKLAPLLLQILDATNGGGRFQTPQLGRWENGRFNPLRPTIYSWDATIRVGEQALEQFSYVWLTRIASPPQAVVETNSLAVTVQGIRVTLGPAGQPLVCEVFRDASGARLVVVGQTLEAAARAEFGPPLAGRRYAVERSPREQPNVVVARVIEEGPMDLGPIVYLAAEGSNVLTVLCRCMPAQVGQIAGTATCDLVPLEREARQRLSSQLRQRLGCDLDWPATPLHEWLRLPRKL